MRFLFFIKITLILLISSLFCTEAQSKEILVPNKEKYQAIVLGEIIKSKIKKIETYYITEYRLKTKEWILKNPSVKKSKYLTIKVLGADLPEKGIIIKASTTPDYIPIKKEAIFFLENLKKKKKNVFTISKTGILPGNKLKELKEEI